MTENVENLMPEHLKRFPATPERIGGRLDELTIRQTGTHTAVIALRRDQLPDAEVGAHLQVQPDRMRARLERIERRLELTN